MPLTSTDDCGTEADGCVSYDYCRYCYQKGAFTRECTMDDMIETCLQFLDEFNRQSGQQVTREEYRGMMQGFFPMLKRWRQPKD